MKLEDITEEVIEERISEGEKNWDYPSCNAYACGFNSAIEWLKQKLKEEN